MAETITVDVARLRAGAGSVRGWVTQFQASPAGGAARAALAQAEDTLSGCRSAPAVALVAGGLDAAAAQVVTALHGFAAGLEAAAAGYERVDVVTGAAAGVLAPLGPGQGGADPARVGP